MALTSTNSKTENDSVPRRAEKARANKGQKAQDFGLTVNWPSPVWSYLLSWPVWPFGGRLTGREKTLAGAGQTFVLENSSPSAWPTLTFCWEEKIIPSVWTQFKLFSIIGLPSSAEVGDTWPNLELLLLTFKLLCFCSTLPIMIYKCSEGDGLPSW